MSSWLMVPSNQSLLIVSVILTLCVYKYNELQKRPYLIYTIQSFEKVLAYIINTDNKQQPKLCFIFQRCPKVAIIQKLLMQKHDYEHRVQIRMSIFNCLECLLILIPIPYFFDRQLTLDELCIIQLDLFSIHAEDNYYTANNSRTADHQAMNSSLSQHKNMSEQSIARPYSRDVAFSDSSRPSNLLKDPIIPNELMGSSQKLGSSIMLESSASEKVIIDRLMQLEGECKIKTCEFIRFNLCKTIAVMVILVISVAGLFLLKYSAPFRKYAFFNPCSEKDATHVYIKGNDKKYEIEKILNIGGSPLYFFYKKLKYSISYLNSRVPVPVAYQFQRQFEECFNQQRLRTGLTSVQVCQRKELYGPNEHRVETPTYFEYLLDVMTEPFFLLQYFFCFVFFIEGYAPFAIALLFFSFITTTINYIMLYISYKKIKAIAEKVCEIKVMREGKEQKIDSRELVPGDIYIPEEREEITADCIVGMGDIYVNEANLTGESFPIGKFKISGPEDVKNSSVWVYEGSKVLETKKGSTFSVAINTGFTTHRGRIIRKILNRTVKGPDILRTTMVFVLEVVIVSVITFFATLYLLLQRDIEKLFIVFKFIDFLASSAPPPLPIFFNLAYSFSLLRLGYRDIVGTQPQKTVDGAQIKTFCFDKTGTLTRNEVSINKIFKIKNGSKITFHNIVTELGDQQNFNVWQLFATCHTTKLIDNELLGDEIDKQMFNFINAKMQNTADPNIRFIVRSTKNFNSQATKDQIEAGKQQEDLIQLQRKRHSLIAMKKEHHLLVLRINQFESRFQSMSVLVRDANTGKCYIFAKGSPEKLLAHSANIAKNSEDSTTYVKMIKTLSLNGFRTIAMGYKQLSTPQQVDHYLKVDRELFLQGINNLGLIAFENRLKVDTWLTIHRLVKSNIDPKMITGDNIYIAVETARRSGIIGMNDKVVFLEGNRNLLNSVILKDGNQEQFTRMFQGTIIDKIKQDVTDAQSSNFTEQVVQIHERMDYLKGSYIFAVDNSFLTMNPPPLLSHNIKVFARIPPQNKAFVIKQYKQQHEQYIRMHYSRFTRWLKVKTWKIGMCGDGANDLLALREADLSVGIQATDASYGSSFTVKNMLDVDWIIKESKCTQANIIQLYQFYGSISFFVLICSIILLTDTTYFSTPELMYMNFGTILLIPGTIAMSRPYGEGETEYVPNANMMSLHNHLMFWGNLLIPFGGVLGCWFFYSNTSEYVPNPKPRVSIADGGFNAKNYSTTLIFVCILIVTAVNGFIVYRSKPWKERFFRNYLFTLLIIANLTVALVFAFLTLELGEIIQFQPISRSYMGICMGILFGSLLLNYAYNLVVSHFKLDHSKIVLEKQEASIVSYIQRKGNSSIKGSMIQRNIGH